MRILKLFVLVFILTSCNQRNVVKSSLNNDSTRVDSKYSKGIWVSYFRKTKTPLGAILKLKIISESGLKKIKLR